MAEIPNVSIIIPARGCKFLFNTVEDIYQKTTGNFEVIVMSDGEQPNPPLKSHKNLTVICTNEPKGMRRNINTAASIAKGQYLMKCDDHCMFGKGFDEILVKYCEDDWLCVPSRYSLDAESWKRGRGPIDYVTLTFPYYKGSTGLNNPKWLGPHGRDGSFYYMEKLRRKIKIDDIIAFQGSCWFMPKNLFYSIDGLDAVNCHTTGEAQELSFKVWLSGGRVVRNKYTWYAHLHKGRRYKRPWRGSMRQRVETQLFLVDYWMNNRWPKQIKTVDWLINKFMPMDTWPEDWQNPKYAEEHIHPYIRLVQNYTNFRNQE